MEPSQAIRLVWQRFAKLTAARDAFRNQPCIYVTTTDKLGNAIRVGVASKGLTSWRITKSKVAKVIETEIEAMRACVERLALARSAGVVPNPWRGGLRDVERLGPAWHHFLVQFPVT